MHREGPRAGQVQIRGQGTLRAGNTQLGWGQFYQDSKYELSRGAKCGPVPLSTNVTFRASYVLSLDKLLGCPL